MNLSDNYPYRSLNIPVICLCKYVGSVKESLIRFKFFNKPSYYRTFAVLMGEKIKKMTSNKIFDIIIGVPLHSSKEKDRGFNQSLLIARALSKQINVLEDSTVISRVKNTKSQSLLGKSERIVNVKDAFKVNNTTRILDKTILLVDDIVTTGSTLGECSRILLEAGAKEVVCVVIASGRIY